MMDADGCFRFVSFVRFVSFRLPRPASKFDLSIFRFADFSIFRCFDVSLVRIFNLSIFRVSVYRIQYLSIYKYHLVPGPSGPWSTWSLVQLVPGPAAAVAVATATATATASSKFVLAYVIFRRGSPVFGHPGALPPLRAQKQHGSSPWLVGRAEW